MGFAQTAHEEYLNSSPDKAQFNKNQWGKLKGKMKQESSGSSTPSGDGFSGNDFSTETGSEGSSYQYENEDYKGEFSEYQNFEDPENNDYEYDEDYDNYEHQDNYYQNDKEYGDGDYNSYEKSKSSTPIKKPKKTKPKGGQPSEGFLTFWKIVAFVLIGALIAFLIYYFFMRYGGSETGATVDVNFDDVPPSEIPKTELERRLEEALLREDYREAIRIYFIFIIKDLSNKDWISWERKKTNMSYLMEMRNKPQFSLFNETVSIYDIVWYGNYTITETNYKEVEPKFKQLLSAIND
jgi:hypothetical protein